MVINDLPGKSQQHQMVLSENWMVFHLRRAVKVLDGGLTHEQWDENENEKFADSDDGHILLKWMGGHHKML